MSVAVVTGAAAGMGRACVDRMRARFDVVVAVDLAVPDIGGTVGLACDIADADAVDDLVARVAELGPFGALVHAAGVSPTMADPRRIFEVDLVGTHVLLDAFGVVVADGAAAVAFASSAAHQVAAFAPDPELDRFVEDPSAAGFLDEVEDRFDDSGLAYAWAKRGVIRSVARASVTWGAQGGRVNSVSPGVIDTGMGRQEMAAQPMMQMMVDNSAIKRMGTPDEVAAVVDFLISPDASFLTGTDVLVDGGCQEGLRALATGSG